MSRSGAPLSQYRFPGFFVYLRDAARRVGRPEAENPARKITPLSALANLCAQAGAADPSHAPAIMAKAEEFRDQLHVAYEAAGLMLADVNRALGLPAAASREDRPARPGGRERNARKRGIANRSRVGGSDTQALTVDPLP